MARTPELIEAERRRYPQAYTGEAAQSYVRAVTAAVMSEGGRGGSASIILHRGWPSDRDADTVLKAASNPVMTSVPGWAGALTMQRPTDFIGVLAPAEVSLVRVAARREQLAYSRNMTVLMGEPSPCHATTSSSICRN